MSIGQITSANTFGQLITAVAAMIAVANNLTDGPQVSSNSAWTFTNPGVGVNVGNTALVKTANVEFLNAGFANIVSGNIASINTSSANITTINAVNEFVTTLWGTDHHTANANISGLLQVSDRMNVFSANIESANIGTIAITSLSVTELTVPVLNASFANITTASITGTFQSTAVVATLVTTDNCNVIRLNATTGNVTDMTMVTMNTSVSNTTTANVLTLNAGFANVVSENVLAANINWMNVSNSFFSTLNASYANITSLFANTGNILSCNIASGNITGRLNVASHPTSNLEVSTKLYTDNAANLWQQLYTTKGDIQVASAAANAIRLGAGTNGQSLIVDTTQTSGLRYASRGPAQTFRNLVIYSTPTNRSTVNTQITLERVDEVVMDDGEVVTDWPYKTVMINVATSGVGGLDTGTILANTWYELYAIRKRTDGTKNFIIHRALDRNADQNTAGIVQFAHNITVAVNKVTAPNVNVAQSFTANVTGNVTSVEVRLFRTGNPAGNCWITMQANTAGSPTGTQLAVSRKYENIRAQTAHMPVKFVFDSNTSVTAGTSYYFTFETDYAANDTAYMTLEGSTTAYFGNATKGWSGAAWTNLQPGIGTLIFREYVEANNTALTYPTGYDQKCLLSYVATDANTKFKEFRQRDRAITTTFSPPWMGYASNQVTNPEVADFSATVTVPPVTCDVIFTPFQVSGVTNYAGFGLLSSMDVPGTAYSEMFTGGFWPATAASQGAIASPSSPPIPIEHQACMVHVGVAITKFFVQTIIF